MSTKKLQERLLSVSNQDPCINAKSRPSLLIDLYNYVDEGEMQKFLWSKKSQIVLINDSFDSIKKTLNSFQDAESFLNFCYDNNIDLSIASERKLIKNFHESKDKIINDIFKKNISTAKKFIKFKNRARAIEREENIYPLYVASAFISGQDRDNDLINAPLLLWEVQIIIENGKVIIEKTSDDITVNEKINFYINNNYFLRIDSDNIKTINDVKKYAKHLNEVAKIDFDKPMEKFCNSNATPIEFKNSVVLALLEPLGGVIKNDIKYIEKKKEEPFEINSKIINYEKITNETIAQDDLISINRPLNLYQKIAIKSSLERNTLIYGPPGTGKSETISSLIANIINNNKCVLMVSEKMAALDVLEKRLSSLSEIALFAFKPEHKDKFYNSLLNIEKKIKERINLEKTSSNKNQKEINKIYNDLLKQFSLNSKNEQRIENIFSFSENFKNIKSLFINEIENDIEQWYKQLDNYWTNKKTIWNAYSQLLKINSLIIEDREVIKTLEKYGFSSTKNQIEEFLVYFNSNKCQSWILKNFLKQKNDYKKVPLIKSQVKNEAAIIKFFDVIIKSDLDEINFDNVSFLETIPKTINNDDQFRQYLLFYIVKKYSKYDLVDKPQYLNEVINNYELNQQKVAKTNDFIISSSYLDKMVIKMKNDTELAHNVNKVISYAHLKNRPNINVLIKEYYDTLRFIFPIWVLSPVQTCILCPCKKNIFDYGIYDEASQMFLENSYPLVYRCKINIVAGDDKQLQPTSFFMKKYDNEEDEDFAIESVNSAISLFEQANVSMWAKFHLKNHYRSDSSKLIAFSNQYIYDNQLEYCDKNIYQKYPIELYEVDGKWVYRHNKEEIEKIIELIQEDRFNNKTILIVTFNQQQATILENTIYNDYSETTIVDRLSNETIKIRSLENVQGDEADIVILSISYAKDSNNKLRNFFGPLSQSSGINRLNVAITRSRQKMIIIKSIKSDDIKHSDNINNNLFKEFLNYVETNANIENDWEVSFDNENSYNDVYQTLSKTIDKNKYEIILNKNIGKYVLDISVFNKETKKIQAAFIIDKLLENNNDLLVSEKINKIKFIKDMMYPIIYFTWLEWYANKQHFIYLLQKYLE